MVKIDDLKSLKELYPELNFESAYESNITLEDRESKVIAHYLAVINVYIAIWEYGYYFLSLAIVKHTSIHKSYLLIAALITKVHSSLHGSFLLNIRGYHPDAIALLRKTHESMIKAIACKVQSPNS